MAIIGHIILAFAKLISLVLNLYSFVVVGAVIISWVNADPHNPIVRFIRQLTEPVFIRVRKILPRALYRTGLDFSPILVFVIIYLINSILVDQLLFAAARHFLQ